MNLQTLPDMARRFDAPVGLSDHTLGIEAPVVAVALAARIIEKHFTLSRGTPGPDSAFSLEPDEFRAMVQAVRTAQSALGSPVWQCTRSEAASTAFRRSLFAVEDIAAGELLTSLNVRSIRPGNGMAPRHLPEILNRRAVRAIPRGTPLSWELIDRDPTP
jgi:sialic acid synthase SpsE